LKAFSFLAPYYDLRVPGLGLGASLFELRPHKSPFGLRPHKQGSGFKVFGFSVFLFGILARPGATALIKYQQIRILNGNEGARTDISNTVWARDCGFWIYGIALLWPLIK